MVAGKVKVPRLLLKFLHEDDYVKVRIREVRKGIKLKGVYLKSFKYL
jgi:hypothetical protein